MSDEDLQLLITLDDPVDPPEEDFFDHLHKRVCTITPSRNGEIVEQKVSYDFRGLPQ